MCPTYVEIGSKQGGHTLCPGSVVITAVTVQCAMHIAPLTVKRPSVKRLPRSSGFICRRSYRM